MDLVQIQVANLKRIRFDCGMRNISLRNIEKIAESLNVGVVDLLSDKLNNGYDSAAN